MQKNKQKILILSNSIDGLFSFRKEVVKTILSKGYEVYISVPKGNTEKEEYFIKEGCLIEYLFIDRRGINPIQDLKLFFRYKTLMKKIKPSVVLTYTIKPNIYGGFAARCVHIPQLANITGLGSSINNDGIIQKIALILYKLGLYKTAITFYQNNTIKEFCEKNRIGKKGILLPGSGVDLKWNPFQEYPTEIPLKFLFIGRVMKDKGIDEFISMANYIRSKYSTYVEFHVLGGCEENYKDILLDLQKKQIIYWHGFVSDIRPYIKDSHCTILPSYHEGMANVLLESCAAGRPIIASNISGCKEIINDGINGFLCEARNSNSLIEKVELFISLPNNVKAEMGFAARKKVENEFDRNLVIETYMEEIENILE